MNLSLKLFLASVVIFVLGLTGVFNPIRNLTHLISNPIQFGLVDLSNSLKDSYSFFINIKGLRVEYLKLLEENEDLVSKLAKLKEVENENRALKEQLGVSKESFKGRLVMAKVIGIPSERDKSEVMVDRGSLDGVTLGSQVIYKNFLVGSVVDVFASRAVVMLLTSPKLSVAVVDQTQGGRTKGLVSGNYGTTLIMDRILPEEEINIGDTIVTSGLDGVFDSGFVVGLVTEVMPIQSEPLKKATINTEIDLGKLERLFILIK